MEPPRPKRHREALGAIIARLQRRVEERQRDLAGELQENHRHWITASLVPTLAACVHALSCAMREGVEAAGGALAELDMQAAATVRVILAGGAQLPENLGQPGAAWPVGALRMAPSGYIRRLLSYRDLPMDRDAFLDHMRALVSDMALLLRQREGGLEGGDDKLREVVTEFVLSMCGHQLKPWGASVLGLNMQTGEPIPEAGPGAFLEVARASGVSERDLMVFRAVGGWWKATAEVLGNERRSLAAQALKAPDDVALQEETTSALHEVNMSYVYYANAAGVILTTLINTPVCVAQTWVASWPRYCVLTPLLEAYEQLGRERYPGASPPGTAAAGAAPPGANGGAPACPLARPPRGDGRERRSGH